MRAFYLLLLFAWRARLPTERSSGKGKVRAVASLMANGGVGHGEATFVISVWYEAEHHQPFRARLTSILGNAPEAVTIYAASREAVLSSVDQWLGKLPHH